MTPSVSSFLKLTVAERTDLLVVEKFLCDGKFGEVSALLESLPIDLFIRLIENSTQLDAFCKQPSQQGLLLKHLHVFDLTDPEFKASNYEPISLYATVKGRFFFGLAVEAAKEHGKYSQLHLEYLRKSSQFDCLYAYNDLVAYGITLLNNNDDKQSYINDVLQPALLASKNHWTSGYILLYQAYFTLGKKFQDKNYSIKALEALLIAERLSEAPESKKAVYNATYGKMKSSLFIFDNWEQARQALVSQTNLAPNEVYIAYRNVHNQQATIKSDLMTKQIISKLTYQPA